MRFTTAAIALIAFIVIFSIFVANVANLVGIDSKLTKRLNAAYSKGEERLNVEKPLKLDDSPRHIMWFLQVRTRFNKVGENSQFYFVSDL